MRTAIEAEGLLVAPPQTEFFRLVRHGAERARRKSDPLVVNGRVILAIGVQGKRTRRDVEHVEQVVRRHRGAASTVTTAL